jgi:hypothetical protein
MTHATVNEDPNVAVIRELKQEIERLRAELLSSKMSSPKVVLLKSQSSDSCCICFRVFVNFMCATVFGEDCC